MPKRIQLSRKKGWRLPANTVIVARPTKYGNHVATAFGYHKRSEAVALYREWLTSNTVAWHPELRDSVLNSLHTLRGKNLACWCALNQPCHADVLLGIANG
ncbi:MAG: DUF4326 domain-containing protein [Candidatus Atribacteria bacterium]|nr:DUF4326 domain-containing protein [Candidatus Atribacteria bacterium]